MNWTCGYNNRCSQLFSTYNIASPRNGYSKVTKSKNTYRGIRTASRGAGTKSLVYWKDALLDRNFYINILIVSGSIDLLTVTIKFISLCCVSFVMLLGHHNGELTVWLPDKNRSHYLACLRS